MARRAGLGRGRRLLQAPRARAVRRARALNVERDQLEIEWGQLQLEQSAWSTHAFVERVAERASCKMSMPATPSSVQIVQAMRTWRGIANATSAGKRRSALRLRLHPGAADARGRRARRRAPWICSSSITAFLTGQGDARYSRASRRSPRTAARSPIATASRSRSARRSIRCGSNPQELAQSADQLPRLAKALKRDPQWLARRVTSNLDREFLYLARHMRRRTREIKALGIPGVYMLREYRRYYPAGEVTGHLLGFTSVDDAARKASSSPSTTGWPARTARSA